jgi:hypothetical protein
LPELSCSESVLPENRPALGDSAYPLHPRDVQSVMGCPHPFTRLPGNSVPLPQRTLANAEPGGYTHEAVCREPIVVQGLLSWVGENYQTRSAPGQDLTLCAIDAIVRPDASSSFGGRHSRMPGRTPSRTAFLAISVPPCQTRSKQYEGSARTALPAGAPWDGAGVSFALCSEPATSVELCLFDGADGHQEVARTALTEQTDLVWDVYSPEVSLIRENGPYELEARSLALLRLQSPLGSGSRSKT